MAPAPRGGGVESDAGGESGGVPDMERRHLTGGLDGFELGVAGPPHVAGHGVQG